MHLQKKKEGMLIIGIFSLLGANLLGKFGGQYFLANFLEGLFMGLSIVMNLCFLIRFSKEKKMNYKN